MRKTLLIVFFIALFAVPCWSAGTDDNFSIEKGEISEAAQSIANKALAEQLAVFGREQKSPLIIASAAQILNGIGAFTEEKMVKEEEAKAKEGATEKTVTGAGNTPESLYAEAISVAKEQGDAALAAVLESQSRVGGTRGVQGGARYNYDRVYGRDNYTFRFVGRSLATVLVTGDGDDIDLYVYDSNGNLIAYDDDRSTVCYVSWTPRQTANYRIVVENASRYEYIDYRIDTN